MKQIKFTDGCPNQCEYCYEPKEMTYYDPEIPEEKEVQILDMNFLSNPKAKDILKSLPKKKYEFVCGIDFRRLDQETCDLMKEKGFKKIRWAWDYGFEKQKEHRKVYQMFKKAGFKNEDLSVFILVNWRIPFDACVKKIDVLKVWNVKVDDCCYDGGYPKNLDDFKSNPRFEDKRFWDFDKIKEFRKMCRKHNHLVNFKIDPSEGGGEPSMKIQEEIIKSWSKVGYLGVKRKRLESFSKKKKHKVNRVIADMRKKKIIVLSRRNYFIILNKILTKTIE